MTVTGDGDPPLSEPSLVVEEVRQEPTRWAHSCGRCGEWACFGFDTRRGVVWACSKHRAEAEMLLEAPAVERRSQ